MFIQLLLAFVKRIHEALALEAFDVHLAGQRSPRRSGSKGIASHCPWRVAVPFEISDHKIVSMKGGRKKADGRQREDLRSQGVHQGVG